MKTAIRIKIYSRFLCFAIALGLQTIIFGSSAEAEYGTNWALASCQWAHDPSQLSSANNQAIFSITGTHAVKECRLYGDSRFGVFFAATKPRKHSSGVCVYRLKQVFPDARRPGAWTIFPTADYPHRPVYEIFFSLADGECGSQEDPTYVQVKGISEGVFLQFWATWQAMTSNEERFNSFLSRTEMSNLPSSLWTSVQNSKAWMKSIHLQVANDDSNLVYVLTLIDPQNPRGHWSLSFDLAGQSFQMLNANWYFQ